MGTTLHVIHRHSHRQVIHMLKVIVIFLNLKNRFLVLWWLYWQDLITEEPIFWRWKNKLVDSHKLLVFRNSPNFLHCGGFPPCPPVPTDLYPKASHSPCLPTHPASGMSAHTEDCFHFHFLILSSFPRQKGEHMAVRSSSVFSNTAILLSGCLAL